MMRQTIQEHKISIMSYLLICIKTICNKPTTKIIRHDHDKKSNQPLSKRAHQRCH